MSAPPPIDWCLDLRADAERYVRGRLEFYAILRGFAPRLAATAVERASAIVEYIDVLYYRPELRHPSYFAERVAFRRWFQVVAYRESLRGVLNPEPCERILCRLPDDQIRLLRWRYFDQFPDADVARVLPPKGGKPFDPAVARLESRQAYDAFCALIRGLAPAVNPKLQRGSAAEFPLYPI